MAFTATQMKALAIAPKVTGVLSMLGSFIIARDVLINRTRRGSTYHRILMGMACVDFSTSFWYSLSTWPIPAGTPGIWYASGTTATCTLQGTLGQIGVATPIYNASLAMYYFFVACMKWEESRIQRVVEPFLHIVPIGYGVGTAIAGVPLKLYNNANLWCWIAGFPLGCKETFQYGDEGNCERGDNSWIYRLVFWYGPIWIVIFVSTFCMAGVYWSVLKQERAVDQVQVEGVTLRKQSRRVAMQASCYLLVFYVTFTPTTVARILQFLFIPLPYWLLFLVALLNPFQGFLNCIVYVRSKYVKFRRAHPRATMGQAIRTVTFSTRKKKSSAHNTGDNADPNHRGEPGEGRPNQTLATVAIPEDKEIKDVTKLKLSGNERFNTEVLCDISEKRESYIRSSAHSGASEASLDAKGVNVSQASQEAKESGTPVTPIEIKEDEVLDVPHEVKEEGANDNVPEQARRED